MPETCRDTELQSSVVKLKCTSSWLCYYVIMPFIFVYKHKTVVSSTRSVAYCKHRMMDDKHIIYA
jgi:hypothetical protein